MQLINDLSVKLERYQDQINASINRVVKSGWLVLGPEVEQFEEAFAQYHNVEHCVSVANGTDALELALRAIGVTPISRVATVANAGAYTTTALNAIGAKPYYLEVEKRFQCVSFASVEAAIESGVDVIVITHLFGQLTPQIKQIAELCAQHNIPLLEDCAQAHGASLNGCLAGTFGDIASFSFYPTKNLGALGDGGAVIMRKSDYAQVVKQLRQYGWSGKYKIGTEGGRNSRLDAIQAAILSDFLPHLNDWNDERIAIALRYDAEIIHSSIEKPHIRGSVPLEGNSAPELRLESVDRPYVAHLYVVQSNKRDSLRNHLKQQNILSDVHYPIPDHKQDIVSDSSAGVNLPVTELLAQTILTLPCYPGMSQEQVNHVIKSVNSWVA